MYSLSMRDRLCHMVMSHLKCNSTKQKLIILIRYLKFIKGLTINETKSIMDIKNYIID